MNILINEPLYLVYNTTYTSVVIGLYKGVHQYGFSVIPKNESSKNLLPYTHALLQKHNVALRDCSFIGVQHGPGPFTTLRVTIASVNGLSFATGIPLVGVNGLYALLDEHSYATPCAVAILDAYCGDLYYAIKTGEDCIVGCAPFETLIQNHLIQNAPATTWIGNGVLLCTEKIRALPHAFILDPLPEVCSLESVARHALQFWYEKSNITNQLVPLYLKSHSALMGKRCVP